MLKMAFAMRSPMALVMLLLSIFSSSYAQNGTLFTPEAMLSAPRRGTALPNPNGTLALYTLSQYSFTTHKTTHGLYVMDLSNGSSWLFSNSSVLSNAIWMGDGDKILWLVSESDGSTSFVIGEATQPGKKYVSTMIWTR
jgi:hypothetical protein